MALSIATLNILDDLAFWKERSPLILEGFDALRPHVIALQEVSLASPSAGLQGARSTAHWLADRLGGYSVAFCPHTADPSSDSLALLSSLPIAAHSILALEGEGRQAQTDRGAPRRPAVDDRQHASLLESAARSHTRRSGSRVARLAGWRRTSGGVRRFQCPAGIGDARSFWRALRVCTSRPARQRPAAHVSDHAAPGTGAEALGPSRRPPRQRPRAPAPQHALRRRGRLHHDRQGRAGGVVRRPLQEPITTGPENLRLRPLRTFRSPRTS